MDKNIETKIGKTLDLIESRMTSAKIALIKGNVPLVDYNIKQSEIDIIEVKELLEEAKK